MLIIDGFKSSSIDRQERDHKRHLVDSKSKTITLELYSIADLDWKRRPTMERPKVEMRRSCLSMDQYSH